MPAGTKQFPTQREHEAYCKASRIACELMPELPVFHTEIRETRSIFLPADSEFRCQEEHVSGRGLQLSPATSAARRQQELCPRRIPGLLILRWTQCANSGDDTWINVRYVLKGKPDESDRRLGGGSPSCRSRNRHTGTTRRLSDPAAPHRRRVHCGLCP